MKAKYEQYNNDLIESGKKYYSPNDPEAVMVKGREGKFPGYNGQIGVETENHFILSNRIACNPNDSRELEDNNNSFVEDTGIIPKEISADKGFANSTQILEVEKNEITECYIPMEVTIRDKEEKDGLIFIFNSKDDTYICPMGKRLTLFARNQDFRGVYYNIYKCRECDECSIKTNCTKSKSGRRIKRNINQDKIDVYKKKMEGQYAKEKIKERKTIVEHPFGTMKILMGKFNFLLRGKKKAQIEFDYYTSAYNLKRLIGCSSIPNLMIKFGKYSI